MNRYLGIIAEKVRNIFFLRVFRSNSERIFQHKMLLFNKKYIFEDEDISQHLADVEMSDIASQNVVKGFIIDRIKFIERTLGNDAIKNETFIDIGDSDGIFIKALDKTGISANISEVAVSNIQKKGIQAIRCDVEHLPFRNSSIDHILFFEIFEHLSNPIAVLNELYRVCKESVFLSIPFVSKTNIHRFNYAPSNPIYEHHIFEFDDEDFRKIVTHSKFFVSDYKVAEVLDGGKGHIFEMCVFLMFRILKIFSRDTEYADIPCDLYMGCFKKFSIYHLVKKKE